MIPRLAPLLLILVLATPAWAGDDASTVTPPILQRGGGDLLPFTEHQRQDFYRQHRTLVVRLQALEKQAEQLETRRAQAEKARQREALATAHAELRRVQAEAIALRLRLTEALVEAGLDPVLIPWINAAPKGRRRAEHYAHGLVLLLPALDDRQRALFERIVPQVEAAYEALEAQKERTVLALKQTQLEPADQRALAGTFDRQLRLIDQRFWLLVDLTLGRDSRVALWKRLPTSMKRKSQAVEHLYQLPGLTPSQGARLKAVLTEMEQEASPDQAALKRIAARLRDRSLSREARSALTKERSEAGTRLSALQRATTQATRDILSEEQWLEYLAIPPRLSINDRRPNSRRVLEGFEPSAAQRAQIEALRKEQREAQRVVQRRMAEIRREGAEAGPDSPQMMSMQMEMAGAQAMSAAAGRRLMGRMFLEVMTPAEVTRWVTGHWGYRQ